MMKQTLEQSKRFEVDVYRTLVTWKGGKFLNEFSLDDGKVYKDLPEPKTDPAFKPDFSKYDVVISNFGWKAAPWPDSTKLAFEEFVSNGGGFVSIHAADNSFPKWQAYNEMIGLGGWGGRNEKDGPYVYFDEEGKQVVDNSKGGAGGHGKQHKFEVQIRDHKHPITKGLPEVMMQNKDELYNKLRGPAKNMTVLATAFDDKKYNGKGRHEPVFMALTYKKGRIFHSTLGHAEPAYTSAVFQTSLINGTEWAATGKVSQ
jgi:type 1 glutamine amidotransferase